MHAAALNTRPSLGQTQRPAGSRPSTTSDTAQAGAGRSRARVRHADGYLIARADSAMCTPAGPPLAAWLQGGVRSAGKTNTRAERSASQVEIRSVSNKLSTPDLSRICKRGINPAHVASALRHGISPDEITELLDQGAGPEAFAFFEHVTPYCTYWSPQKTARRIMESWPEKSEVAFAKLVLLARSEHVKNRCELKSWLNGMAGPRPASEGYATMLTDAVDLVEAGHDIYLEEHPEGLGDIIDITARVTYQHKRVSGKRLKEHIEKACEQLEGFTASDGQQLPGAPPSHKGVVQIDLRYNPNFNTEADVRRAMPRGVAQHFERVDEIQVVLEDELLRFNTDGFPKADSNAPRR